MNFLIPSTHWNENELLFENVHSPCKLRCFDVSFIRTERCIERQIIIKDHQHVGETCIIIIKNNIVFINVLRRKPTILGTCISLGWFSLPTINTRAIFCRTRDDTALSV